MNNNNSKRYQAQQKMPLFITFCLLQFDWRSIQWKCFQELSITNLKKKRKKHNISKKKWIKVELKENYIKKNLSAKRWFQMVDHRFSEQKNCKIPKFCKKIRNETLIQYEKRERIRRTKQRNNKKIRKTWNKKAKKQNRNSLGLQRFFY